MHMVFLALNVPKSLSHYCRELLNFLLLCLKNSFYKSESAPCCYFEKETAHNISDSAYAGGGVSWSDAAGSSSGNRNSLEHHCLPSKSAGEALEMKTNRMLFEWKARARITQPALTGHFKNVKNVAFKSHLQASPWLRFSFFPVPTEVTLSGAGSHASAPCPVFGSVPVLQGVLALTAYPVVLARTRGCEIKPDWVQLPCQERC